MAEDGNIINMPSNKDSFGALTRDQLLEITKNPKLVKIDAERGGGTAGFDPMGARPKLSEVQQRIPRSQAEENLSTIGIGSTLSASRSPVIGTRCYHRKHKLECTIMASIDDTTVQVTYENGETKKAKIKNLTALR